MALIYSGAVFRPQPPLAAAAAAAAAVYRTQQRYYARAFFPPSTSHGSMPRATAATALVLTVVVPAVMAASLRPAAELQGAKINQVRGCNLSSVHLSIIHAATTAVLLVHLSLLSSH